MDRTIDLTALKQSLEIDHNIPVALPNAHFISQKSELKSGVIDSLMTQNEDLTAKYRVLLRRLSTLEEENLRYHTENKEYKNQLDSVSDHISVFKEKESKWRERCLAAEEALDYNQAIIRKKEIEFAQMRSQDRLERENLKKHTERLDHQRLNLIRYRARIKLYVRPLLQRFKKALNEALISQENSIRTIDNQKLQIHKITEHHKTLLTQYRDDVKKLEEAKLHIILQFEKQQSDLKQEINSLKETNYELQIRSDRLDKSIERQDYLENRVIELERTLQDLKNQYLHEKESLQGQLVSWRSQAQSLEVQNQTLNERTQEISNSLHVVQNLSERQQEQLETIRLLWSESSQEVQRLRQINQSLEQLNSDLCIKINAKRIDEAHNE